MRKITQPLNLPWGRRLKGKEEVCDQVSKWTRHSQEQKGASYRYMQHGWISKTWRWATHKATSCMTLFMIHETWVIDVDWGWGRKWPARGTRELFGVKEKFCILFLMVVTWHLACHWMFVKTPRTIRIKGVNFTVCKLCLHKPDFKKLTQSSSRIPPSPQSQTPHFGPAWSTGSPRFDHSCYLRFWQ